MTLNARVVTSWVVRSGALVLLSASLFAQQAPQPIGARQTVSPLDTEVRHIGTAEVKTVVNEGFYPSRQPMLYWHGPKWAIDLLIPAGKDDPYSISIRSANGTAHTVKLPDLYAQVDSILVAPGDKAIIIADCGGDCGGFVIVDLKDGTVIDDILFESIATSPNRRFILYDNAYTPHSEDSENLYHLYDTLKPPRENVCGYRDNDPKHEDLDQTMRGFQIYPQKPRQIHCTDHENSDLNDDNIGTNFTWSPDSSKIVFADVKNGVMSLILVTMPIGANDLPKTSTYPLVGAENVCAGATDAAGQPNCDYHVIQSLGWDGDTVTAVFNHRFGTKLNLTMAIPVSRFTPIGK